MALIRRADAAQVARHAVVLDLGDLQAQGRALIQGAQREAARILSEARQERVSLYEGALQEGRAEGQAEGHAAGLRQGVEQGHAAALAERRADLDRLSGAWGEALVAFIGAREHVLASAQRDVLRLAAMIAGRVVKRAVGLNPGVVKDQIAAAIGLVLRPTRLVIAVSPSDAELARAAVPALMARTAQAPGGQHAEVVEDPSLEPGSCVVRLGEMELGVPGGVVDASIGTQLERMVEAMLPGEGAAARPTPAAGAEA